MQFLNPLKRFMEGDFIKIKKYLLPLSFIYGLIIRFRNFLFDTGVLKSRSFTIPVISVGNITVGGSGKTPHVEYLIRLLKDSKKVTVLSRGYKRKTKHFQLAGKETTARHIGDEPYQMFLKYGDQINVAVDANRCEGIDLILKNEKTKDTDVILLDDAFQHRYVKPGVNILLVDYHRLIIYDKMLPSGCLREPQEGKQRADIVIVTKCPENLRPMDYRVITKGLNLYPYQKLFFTTIRYEELRPVFPEAAPFSLEQISKNHNVVVLSGIASPKHLLLDLANYTENLHPLTFSDHHAFSDKDISRLNNLFDSLNEKRIIITTEKDAARLVNVDGLSNDVKSHIYALPISVAFMLDYKEQFDDFILSYVMKNSKDSVLAKTNNRNEQKNNDKADKKTISF